MAHARFPDSCEEQDVAIKVISKSVQAYRLGQGRIKHPGWTTMVATTETINSETEILKGFLDSGEHSPFLTPLLAAFQDNTNVYLVMRLYPETLAYRLGCLADEGMKLGETEIRLYAAEILCALKTLHEKHHTVHRDLKFRNIPISPSGHLCLADFGLSIRGSTRRPLESIQVHKAGTLPYLAPEVFSTSRTIFCGTALDIWAFGMLLLEMFEGTGEPHLYGRKRDCEVEAVPDVYQLVGDPEAADLIDLVADRLTLSGIQDHAFFASMLAPFHYHRMNLTTISATGTKSKSINILVSCLAPPHIFIFSIAHSTFR
ncbi:kinase-like domain-containing protein [Mycena leptocephala]|nr:kinase-like domain-containing protein [Mycena leptocephala]